MGEEKRVQRGCRVGSRPARSDVDERRTFDGGSNADGVARGYGYPAGV
jgi:hypothetical protein